MVGELTYFYISILSVVISCIYLGANISQCLSYLQVKQLFNTKYRLLFLLINLLTLRVIVSGLAGIFLSGVGFLHTDDGANIMQIESLQKVLIWSLWLQELICWGLVFIIPFSFYLLESSVKTKKILKFLSALGGLLVLFGLGGSYLFKNSFIPDMGFKFLMSQSIYLPNIMTILCVIVQIVPFLISRNSLLRLIGILLVPITGLIFYGAYNLTMGRMFEFLSYLACFSLFIAILLFHKYIKTELQIKNEQ